MTYPLKAPYNRITTEYGKRGTAWGCNKDASGKGVHTGVDLSAPRGTPIFAPCDGQIRHRSYGSALGNHQFAISPDPGQAFAAGEIFFAHTSTRMADGAYVKMGQQIAVVGSEGNASGPHVHMEYHPNTKDVWNCSVHANPKPVLLHGLSTDAPYITKDVYRSKCGYGEPTNGDANSDTVKELQERLNRAGLTGGLKLIVTGKYDANTDTMVRLWQEQFCHDTPDTARKSYLGPNQFAAMFPDVYELHDDGNPAIASPPTGVVSAMGKRFQRVNKYVTARVVYAPNWDNDIIKGNGAWDPKFFLLHHTAIKDDPDKGASSLGYILSGGGYAPVRLANWHVARDGTLTVCAARQAYQAGIGEGFGVPKNEMNHHSAGVEIESMGRDQDLTDAQILTVSQLWTGWVEEFKVTDDKALNHKDWSTTGKQDTLYSMTWWRTQFKTWNKPPVIPPVEPPIKPPEVPAVADNVLIWHDYTDKPLTTQIFAPGKWVQVDTPPLKKVPASGHEDHMVYARLNFTWKDLPTADSFDEAMRTIANYAAKVEIKFVRGDGDATAMDERHFSYGTKSVPFQQVHWETGEKGLAGTWWIKVHGGLASVEITTRYAKTSVIAKVT